MMKNVDYIICFLIGCLIVFIIWVSQAKVDYGVEQALILSGTVESLRLEVEAINNKVDKLDNNIRKDADCIPFNPKIGDYIYKEITNDIVDNKEFWTHQGIIIHRNERVFVEIYVIELVGDGCIESVNGLGSNNRLEKLP